MHHFPYSLLDLLEFAFYIAWFAFLIWFIARLVRALRAVEDLGRTMRIIAYDIRQISDDVHALKEKQDNPKS